MTKRKRQAVTNRLTKQKEHRSLFKKILEVYGWRGDHLREGETYEGKAVDAFLDDCERYCKAIKDGRVFTIIHSVSRSGMSRVMSFHEASRYDHKLSDGRTHCFLNFYSLFKALGYTEVSDGFRISGCGMDMIFATNYNVIHSFKYIGLINDPACAKMSQMTPTYF